MHKPFVLAAAALLGSATLAAAQPSPPPAPPPAASDTPAQQQPGGDGMRERMRGGGMMREAYMRHGMEEQGPRAARFRFEKEGAMVGIQCANNETTRACVDAAAVLIDKLAAQPGR